MVDQRIDAARFSSQGEFLTALVTLQLLLISLLDRVCKMFFALEQEDRNSVSAFLATNDFRMNDQWDKWIFLTFCEILLYQELNELQDSSSSCLDYLFFLLFIIVYIHLFKSQICKIFRLKSNVSMRFCKAIIREYEITEKNNL